MHQDGGRIHTMSRKSPGFSEQEVGAGWTYLTNHAHVLIYLAGHPGVTLREAAGAVGITERAVLRIVAELEEDGVLRRVKQGRRNEYEIDLDRRLRHPVENHCKVGELLDLVVGTSSG